MASFVRVGTRVAGLSNGSPFYPTIPGLVCCSDFKGGSKARCSSSTNSSSVAIPSALTLIEYHTVALEPVLEHPRLLAVSGLRRRAGPGPAVPRTVARHFAQCTRGDSRAPTGPLGRQLTDTMVEHRSLPLRLLGQVEDGEGRSGRKGGEGPARGGNRSRCSSARSCGSTVASSL
jgi:hypothetical protein